MHLHLILSVPEMGGGAAKKKVQVQATPRRDGKVLNILT